MQFRCQDSDTSDSQTHIDTRNTLRTVAGRPDVLFVADSRPCASENLDHIDRAGGRFLTVMPRSRLQDAGFRKSIQDHTPASERVWERPSPRRSDGPATALEVEVKAISRSDLAARLPATGRP